MKTVILKSFAELAKRLQADDRDFREQKLRRAIQKTLREAVKILIKNAPLASGHFRDGFDVEMNANNGGGVTTDAPKGMIDALEYGRLPGGKMPPVDAIEKWVRLKGAYGISKTKALRRVTGAKQMASAIASRERGGAVSVDAPREIAWAIARSIQKNGTKPTHFILKSQPEIRAALDRNLKAEAGKE